MKKVFAIIFVSFLLLGNLSFAQMAGNCVPGTSCGNGMIYDNNCICVPETIQEGENEEEAYATADCATKLQMEAAACAPTPPEECESYVFLQNECAEEEESGNTVTVTPGTTINTNTPMGLKIDQECLLNGQCGFNVYDALGIRQSVRETGEPTSVGIFVQDIVLAVTMFIGTVVTVAIIVSGLMWIMAGATGKDPTKAKSGLINALIGLLIVVSSYMIIRLVQYIAKGV